MKTPAAAANDRHNIFVVLANLNLGLAAIVLE
jgi:hypothetical protein